MRIQHSIVVNLLNQYAVYYGSLRGREVWLASNGAVVSFVAAEDYDYDIVEAIAIEQLELDWMEWDFWLGENDIQ